MKVRVSSGVVLLSLLVAGCHAKPRGEEAADLKVNGDMVVLASDSAKLAALSVEPAGQQKPSELPLGGRLVWDEDATVRVFTPFAGIVRKLYVDLNQSVSTGAPLAEIQSPDYGTARADQRKAEGDFRRAERNLDRLKDLFDHGAAPRKDVESAEADFTSAQAEKDRTIERLAIYGATGSSNDRAFLLPSPLDGMLVEKNVNPGQEVRPDQMLANTPQFTAPLFVVTDPARLWIQIDATEADLPSLRPGQPFTFTSRAFPSQIFTGLVTTVSEFIDPNTRTIKVRGKVDNSARVLKAEMFVNVKLPGQLEKGVSVPAKAVFLKGDKHYVFVAEQPGHFVRKEVKTGPEQDGRILILAGVEVGQRIVTEGCVLLQQILK